MGSLCIQAWPCNKSALVEEPRVTGGRPSRMTSGRLIMRTTATWLWLLNLMTDSKSWAHFTWSWVRVWVYVYVCVCVWYLECVTGDWPSAKTGSVHTAADGETSVPDRFEQNLNNYFTIGCSLWSQIRLTIYYDKDALLFVLFRE